MQVNLSKVCGCLQRLISASTHARDYETATLCRQGHAPVLVTAQMRSVDIEVDAE